MICRLKELIATQTERPQPYTFLEVIGRAYDENLVSRMLAFALKNNNALCAALFEHYLEKANKDWDIDDFRVQSVRCEQIMASGRADIFVEAYGYTLTIENKINSWEHGNQTKIYYDYVSSQHSNRKNGFIYLKPDYNDSMPSGKSEFVVMHYSELLNIMKQVCGDNEFEKDLKNHIEKYFLNGMGNIMETDLFVLEHYRAVKEMVANAENKFSAAKDEIKKTLLSGELIGGAPIYDFQSVSERGAFVSDITKDIWFRIARNKVWWNDEAIVEPKQKFYFYLELVIEDPEYITTQMVVRCYGGRKAYESDICKFMESEGREFISGTWGSPHFVAAPCGKFVSSNAILSAMWMKDLYDYIKSTFQEYLPKIDSAVAKFKEWQSHRNA